MKEGIKDEGRDEMKRGEVKVLAIIEARITRIAIHIQY